MKKIWLPLILALLCAALLAACQGGPAGTATTGAARTESTPKNPRDGAGDSDTPASTSRGEPTTREEPTTKEPAQDDALLREDADGLVRVRILDGVAEISFNLERWDELYDIHRAGGNIRPQTGVYPIEPAAGAVKDACIGTVAELGAGYYEGIVLPTVMLLMEDGTLEYLLADALSEQQADTYYSRGVVPWLEGIETLACEDSGEGIGGDAIYAMDAAGVRYDAGLAARYRLLCSGEWEAQLDPELTIWDGCIGRLVFLGEEQVEFVIVSAFEVSASYHGGYRVVLTDDDASGYRKGIMVFDLKLDWEIPDGADESEAPRPEINSACFAEMTPGQSLELWIADGDCLYNNQYNELDGPKEEYFFAFELLGRGRNAATGDAIYDRRVLNTVCAHSEVAAYLAMGMQAECSGEAPEIDGAACFEVALGTRHEDHFVREIFYALDSFSGQIYEFDALVNDWRPLDMD